MAANNNIGMDSSSEEFQRKLFDWFDQRGLLTELRTFMRQRMISALYSADSPCKVSPTRLSSESSPSPTLQALLLLVAEFLIQQEYHYTLSVLVSEVPLLASLPKFSDYVKYMSSKEPMLFEKTAFPRYTDAHLKEILEVLGILPNSESSLHIHRLYNNNGARESLLACVLTALAAIAQHNSLQLTRQDKGIEPTSKSFKDTDEFTKWLEEVRLVLLRAQLTSLQQRHMEDLLWSLYSDTVSKVRKEEQEKHSHHLQVYERQLQADALLREEQFRTQAEEVENDLKKKQAHLQQVTSQLRQQHDEVLSRLNRVQKHADEVRRQEDELVKREKLLEKKEKIIEREQQVLADLQQAASSIQHEQADSKALVELGHLQERCSHLEAELKETKAHLQASSFLKVDAVVQTVEEAAAKACPPELSSHRLDLSSASSNASISFSACGSTAKPTSEKPRDRNNQIALLKRVLRRVQQENSELRAHASQQRRRIDELTTRAAQLAAHIASLGPGSPAAPQQAAAPTPVADPTPAPAPAPTPPPPAPPLPPRHGRHGVPVGAGGDLRQPNARHSSHTARLQGREWRRKPPKRLLQHSSLTTSLSSDDSPSEEVLREARSRLRRLEEESEIVDRRYRDFRARQADTLASTASLLFIPAQDEHTNAEIAPETYLSFSAPPAVPRRSPLSTVVTRSPGNGAFSLRPSSGLLSSLPTSPQSQFTLPERSAYNSSLRTSFRSDDPIPHRPSVLRRPSERIKHLLNTRAHLFKNLATDGENIREEQPSGIETFSRAADVNAVNGTEIKESTGDSNIRRATQNLKDLQLAGDSLDAGTTKHAPVADSEVMKRSQDLLPSDVKSKETIAPSQSLQSDRKVEEPRVASASPSHATTRPPEHVGSPPPAPPPPPPQRLESLSSQDGAGAPVARTTTLNEVSTLSSSPGASPVAAEDINLLNVVESVPAPSSHSKPIASRTSSPSVTSVAAAQRAESAASAFASTPQQPLSHLTGLVTRASLSSIEASDQAISVGSDGKRTDEDDDFW